MRIFLPGIQVIGEITSETFEKYVRQTFREYPNDRPEVLISSPGGEIGYVLAMLDDIDEKKRTTYATGICQSAAAVLATAGEGKRVCTMDTLFRFIPPEMETPRDEYGNRDEVSDLRHYLHSLLVARLQSRLKWSLAETNDLFDGEFINSMRAKELGLVDEVISTEVVKEEIQDGVRIRIIDRRSGEKIPNGQCDGYRDQAHHDGGNDHVDRYQCVRPKGHAGNHYDYIIPGDKVISTEVSNGNSDRLPES